MLGPVIDVHTAQSNANGTRGDDDNSVAIFLELGSRVDNECENWKKRFMCCLVDN